MKPNQSETWLSCYLYYKDSPDIFLSQSVLPFVRQTSLQKDCSGFFFIRYRDSCGPHIRLRLKTDNTKTEKLKTAITRTFPKARFARYVPETRRYGGPHGLALAERFFEMSSAAILKDIATADDWNYSQAIGRAVQLQLGMACGLGMTKRETVALSRHITEGYIRNGMVTSDQLVRNFASQQENLVPYVEKLWKLSHQNSQSRLTSWIHAVETMHKKLNTLYANKLLDIPYSSAHESNQLWYLYESYIHMTNNRLGLTRPDEALVAYILQESLHD